MSNETENHVRNAVDTIGGPTATSNLLGVSNACIYKWIQHNRVTKLIHARKLAELAGVPVELVRPVQVQETRQ